MTDCRDLLAAGQQLYDATDGNSRAQAASRWEDITEDSDRWGIEARRHATAAEDGRCPESDVAPTDERPCVYDRLEDSGGSSFLCDCKGVDTGVHESWCKSWGNPAGNTP